MSRLKIRLFGGFQIHWRDTIIDSFESQKVRALCAYLAHAQRRSCSRDVLATLFWPNNSSDGARRNLRQALYSLRRAIADHSGETFSALRVAQQSIQLQPGPEIWIDTEEFQEHLRAAQSSTGDVARDHLAAAAQLYSGGLLAGFHVKGCPGFDEWWLLEQEQLRDAAAGALRSLVDHHLAEGNYSLGVKYARQLLKIDPFSEDAHRKLMRLHAMSGRRGRALAVYQDLYRVLMDELAVEPSEETTADYEAILDERLPEPAVLDKVQSTGPMIPMLGRDQEVQQLRKSWESVRSGSGRFSLVTGEQGVGKTRLLRFTLHEASESVQAVILRGRYPDMEIPVCFAGLQEALTNAVLHEPELAERVLSGMSPQSLSILCRLVPQLRDLQPGLPRVADQVELIQMADAVLEFLRQISKPAEASGPLEPVIFLIDDLQWADSASLQMLHALVGRIADHPIWIIGSSDDDEGAVAELALANNAEVIRLQRLPEEETAAIADSLLGPEENKKLAHLLRGCNGLPLLITEVVNLLWDRDVLRSGSDGGLQLDALPEDLAWLDQDSFPLLGEIIVQRVATLPWSTRRLLTLAAIIGDGFDADLLHSAEGEHETVIEIGLQILLEHWMIRHILGYWADSRRDRDIALWFSGPAKGVFEFIHVTVQRELYRRLSPERRKVLHRRVAAALEQQQGRDENRLAALLAHHRSRAGEWRAAALHFRQAAEFARRLGAKEPAIHYLEAGISALEEAAATEKPFHRSVVEDSIDDLGKARQELTQQLLSLQAATLPPAAGTTPDRSHLSAS